MKGTEMEELKQFITEHVDYKFELLQMQLNEYIKGDLKWKESAQPSIELGRNVNGFGIVLAYVLGTIAGIYGIFRIFFRHG